MIQSALDDVEVVFDDDDGVAVVGEAVQDLEEVADVGEVQAGGGFVEDVEGVAGLAFAELGGELDALGFAAGEGGGGLAEMDVAEADVDEGLELLAGVGDVAEEGEGVFDGEVEDVGDGVAAVFDVEGFVIVTAAFADFALTKTSGRKCISMRRWPSPWQASQRPPLTLKEKRPAL